MKLFTDLVVYRFLKWLWEQPDHRAMMSTIRCNGFLSAYQVVKNLGMVRGVMTAKDPNPPVTLEVIPGSFEENKNCWELVWGVRRGGKVRPGVFEDLPRFHQIVLSTVHEFGEIDYQTLHSELPNAISEKAGCLLPALVIETALESLHKSGWLERISSGRSRESVKYSARRWGVAA